MVTVSDDFCVVLWKVIDRDGRGKKMDREIAYTHEILIPKPDLKEKVHCVLLARIRLPFGWHSFRAAASEIISPSSIHSKDKIRSACFSLLLTTPSG